LKKHANNLTVELVFSPSGHAFIRKWMLLSDPGDKEAEDEEAVSVHAQLNNLINNKSKPSSEQVSFVFLLVLNFLPHFSFIKTEAMEGKVLIP